MDSYSAPLDDMHFLLDEVFNANAIWSDLPAFQDINLELADSLLREAGRLASDVLAPLNRIGDEAGCVWSDGQVSTPPGFKDAYETFSSNGWTAVSGDAELGASNLPKSLAVLLDEMFCGANIAFALYSLLSRGAALCLETHGSKHIRETYLPKLYSGEWTGTMCLTEAHSGSDLGLVSTRAKLSADGSYSITGNKIFITGGEHDLAENIIHLVLARLPGAPAGSRGLSLFVVPKFLLDGEGKPAERNKVSCISIEHKMGINGSATCTMAFDGATGWLVGEENRGLSAMFTMMNEERLSISLQGVGLAEAAYQRSRIYAQERIQGKSSNSEAASPIIRHGDVRRMLITMRALTEGGRALAVYAGLQIDLSEKATDPALRRKAAERTALLIPTVKAFFTDRGFEACVLGQQIFGGHGYIREQGVEQLVRDARIAQIYEGTNGIQAIDLLQRKIGASKGTVLFDLISEIEVWTRQWSREAASADYANRLLQALGCLSEITNYILQRADDRNFISAVACEYLDLFGYVLYGWMWGRMMSAAERLDEDVRESKLAAGHFYFHRILARIHSLAIQIKSDQSFVADRMDLVP